MERVPPPMDADMRMFVRWMASASPGASLVESHGVLGAVVPAAPERSVFNSVVYPDAGSLEQALPDLAAVYDAAGVRAWTVWVPPGDRLARDLLSRAGNVLDAEPAAMIADLGGFQAPDPGDLDWSYGADPADVGRINDAAYGYDDRPFSRALQSVEGLHSYIARVEGEPASVLVIGDSQTSAGVYFVATLPEAQGRGLAYRLLGRALADARDRGLTAATLQATRMGAAVYERLGFRSHGPIEMWERRGLPGRRT